MDGEHLNEGGKSICPLLLSPYLLKPRLSLHLNHTPFLVCWGVLGWVGGGVVDAELTRHSHI